MFAEFKPLPAGASSLDMTQKPFAQRVNLPHFVENDNAVTRRLTTFSVFAESLESWRVPDARRMVAVGVSSSAPLNTCRAGTSKALHVDEEWDRKMSDYP